MVLDDKYLQEYPVNAGVPAASIHGPALFLLYISDLPDDAICNIAIYTDDTTHYSKCDLAFWALSKHFCWPPFFMKD